MKKIYVLLPIIAILVVLALLLPKIQGPKITENQITDNTLRDQMFSESNNPAANKVSLAALMEKQFDGRDLTLGKILAENEFYTRYYITYKSGGLNISGILNVPKSQVPTGGFPILFLNHGFIEPSVYTNGRGLRREQDYLARQGFAVLHSDYRNHAGSDKDPESEQQIRLGYVEDVINAVEAVRNSNFDFLSKDLHGMLGHSMGGGITQSVLVVKPELLKAAVLYAPVSMDASDSYERWTTRRPEIAKLIAKTHGTPESNPSFWEGVSAKTYLERISAPIQIYHGEKDADVPIEWSQNSQNLLVAASKNSELIIYANQPHEFTGEFWTNFMQGSSSFFKKNLFK